MMDAVYLMGCLGTFLAWQESKQPFSFWVVVSILGWPTYLVYSYMSQRVEEDAVESTEKKP